MALSPAVSRALQPELTLRGIALGVVITILFTAANVYLGLKIGLTFATSIPAAVISMALLRLFRDAGILENNIVQTVASSAGALAAVIFVVPGLVMVGWWQAVPFWETFALCASGGLLGVVLSIPLRRALVTGSDLPYPEGVAAAEVLRVGCESDEGAIENKVGLRVILIGSLASIGFSLLAATRLVASEAATWFRVGGAATGLSASLSFALLGAGHLVGLSSGMAMFTGLFIAYGVATPLLTSIEMTPGSAADAALGVWRGEVRFIGAGVIGATALWTLAQLAQPIAQGLRSAAAASRARKAAEAILPIEEQDIPLPYVGLVLAGVSVPILALLWGFAQDGVLAPFGLPLMLGGFLFVLVAGVFVSAVCGYMAGLIGSSNSPVSGVAILAVLGASLLLAVGVAPLAAKGATEQLVAFALFINSIVIASAVIANDNLQDLKTGQLVGATPWRQQVALMVGVIAGSLVVPPVLDLLNTAYGFAPLPGVAGIAPVDPLPAPQATLISTLARGVLGAGLDWHLIGIGVLLGLGLIALDLLLGKRGWLRLPPLAVGIGIYLPMSVTSLVVLGAVIGHYFDKRAASPVTRRMGVLLASGFIMGESLFGVLLAGVIVASGASSPFALLGEGHEDITMIVGSLLMLGLLGLLYRWTARVGGRI